MIVDSLRELGAARSIVIDEDNVVLAGNGVVEGAGEIGLEKVIIVEATGNEIVAVRRRGLTDEQKADLALRDNRAGELSTWSPPVLKGLAETMDLSHLFYESELDKIIRDKPTDEDKERAPDMALKLDERYNYVVLLFRDQPTWDRACDVLKVQKVTADHGGVSKVGLGRVLDGKPIVDALQNAAAAAKESK